MLSIWTKGKGSRLTPFIIFKKVATDIIISVLVTLLVSDEDKVKQLLYTGWLPVFFIWFKLF